MDYNSARSENLQSYKDIYQRDRKIKHEKNNYRKAMQQ